MPVYEFRRFLSTNFPDVCKVFVRDNSGVPGGRFYFSGLDISEDSQTQQRDTTTSSVETNLATLKEVIGEADYSRVIFIGNSSGAFAAVLYGLLLGVDSIMGFGTFTNITQDCLVRQEMQFSHVIRKLWAELPAHKYYDLRSLSNNSGAEIQLVYGSLAPLDKVQAHYLADTENVSITCCADAGHAGCIRVYRDNGKLKTMIEESLVAYKLLS